MFLEAGAFSRAFPIVTSHGAAQRGELSPHNTRRSCALDVLPHAFNYIDVFKCAKNNFTPMKHISESLIGKWAISFDSHDR